MDQRRASGMGASRKPGYVFVLPWEPNTAGGVNQVVVNLYRQMDLAGELLPVIMVSKWSALRPIERIVDGRPTIYWRLWSPWAAQGSIVGSLKWIVASPIWIFDLLRLCRRHRVVAFNFHYPGTGTFSFALLRFLRLYRGAIIISYHGLDLHYARGMGPVGRALWRFVLRYATAIVACSRAFAAEVSAFAGKAAHRIQVIHNGLDLDHFLGNLDRASGLPAMLVNRDFIASVATWEHNKGLDILLRAFSEIRATNAGIALVLIGRAGDAESSLRTLAKELGVADDVFFLESVSHDQVGLYLEHAKAFCLPSRWAEPFGIAILEAGAFRLPVVASRVGGIPEIIVDENCGLLVEPNDVKGLVAALDRVLSNPDLARDLGARLHERVVNEFSWERAYQKYRKLFM